MIKPVQYRCLIEQDEVEEKTSGGIIMPDSVKEQRMWAETKATLIDHGGNAFESWKGYIPKKGDRIYTAKYAGVSIEGKDGKTYRLVNDEDITAVEIDDE